MGIWFSFSYIQDLLGLEGNALAEFKALATERFGSTSFLAKFPVWLSEYCAGTKMLITFALVSSFLVIICFWYKYGWELTCCHAVQRSKKDINIDILGLFVKILREYWIVSHVVGYGFLYVGFYIGYHW